MVFVTLVLTEFFKAYSFRSDRRSVFHRTLANTWLNWAVLWELTLLLFVVYVPFLQVAFDTFSLTRVDWLFSIGAAVTIIPVLETAKWVIRRLTSP
jgi:Ca2+-transporting ATPase